MSANSVGLTRTLDLPPSRIELVLSEIREGILTRKLAPGQPLVEAEFAKAMGVSKTPVREALKILSQSGLVTFTPFKGASVTTVDPPFIRSVAEVRLLLEPEAVRRAVSDGDPGLFQGAATALDEARDAAAAGDQGRLSLLNRQFHASMYAGCGNQMLIDILENLRDRAALISVVGWTASPTWETEWAEHRAILEAALNGDAGSAADLLRNHLQEFMDRALKQFTP
ncbi:GntR family transcriptional regulator [Zafaria cholistanensis]|uniref:GntR family transcriptional regulator n=1 Tax=Zafaria cholistanensis TaxID=1682741 RepID=A0A5A7NRF5_9MICC|nr:GntR family transcriptional regulator [Zafaria cholistanensis]GER23299.1 GntR family transcriptional regulator [Zafaria cholistanensis]